MQIVIYLKIGPNEEGQRLDRFLRKYLSSAPLSVIYKTIRKDVKVNGKRKSENYLLAEGDEVVLYMSEADFKKYEKRSPRQRAKRQFEIAYEDENLLIVSKPFGLLTHGDSKEKKNHLSNQVLDYLIEQGGYNPRIERTFTPAPANRLDRNTTGLVIFGKNAAALREVNRLLRDDNGENRNIGKYYLTIVYGELNEKLDLRDEMIKDEVNNRVQVIHRDRDMNDKKSVRGDRSSRPKIMRTRVTPISVSQPKNGDDVGPFSLVEAEILTGRTHQIRAQLGAAGFPLIGDPKYGDKMINRICRDSFGVNTQMLHAARLEFDIEKDSTLAYMNGKIVESEMPENFADTISKIGFSLHV